ncbi:hypothetical protein KR009_000337 [Drosophila setifemur]|nr:hypothetical protein KR009_000337 [Drosophila setifemur]
MESLAVSVAAVFQLLGCAFFFSQPKDRCSPAPDLASFLFLGAILCYLRDACFYPRRFNHMARGWVLMVQIVTAIFLTELGTIVIWCGLERFLFGLTDEFLKSLGLLCIEQSILIYWVSGLVTCTVGGAALWYILEATDGMYQIKKFKCYIRHLKYSWRSMKCFLKMSHSDRCRALTAYKIAVQKKCPEQECEDESDSCCETECS